MKNLDQQQQVEQRSIYSSSPPAPYRAGLERGHANGGSNGPNLSMTQQRLRRTPSQSSFSSTNLLRTGAQTPQTTIGGPSPPVALASLSLNQLGKVRCIQSLSQRPPSAGTPLTSEEPNDSVLTLAQSDHYVFSGSQRGDIHVWSRDTYRLIKTLRAHTAGCLSLALDRRRGVLFSGGGDGKVRAWDVSTFKCLYAVHAGVNSGAILSLAYSQAFDSLVLGCQNTSIQVFSIAQKDSTSRRERMREMAARKSRFFDDAVESIAVCGSFMPTAISDTASDDNNDSCDERRSAEEEQYVIFDSSIVDYAHSGYVYSLLLGHFPSAPSSLDEEVLYSAGSDGEIKVWKLGGSVLEEIALLDRGSLADGDTGEDVCVHSLALDDELLFAGLQSGEIEVWDLETMQRIRLLSGHSANVFTLLVHAHCVYSGSADGTIRMWSSDLQGLGWISPASTESTILCLDMSSDDILISGSGDSAIAFWDVTALDQAAEGSGVPLATNSGPALGLRNLQDTYHHTDSAAVAPQPALYRHRRKGHRMMQALDQWIRFKSVSGVPELQPECRRAARFLKDLMRQLGASDARLISSTPSSNPLVYGRFDASLSSEHGKPLEEQPTVFVYGHYDVMPAGDEELWRTNPFELVGRDGYLYGRGVSDDKGPVLATLFAVSELHEAGQLPITVVFCIEGEEEHGSLGLHETMVDHRSLFGQPRLILLSLSYWLGETTPCLTYGMRGSIRANLRIESTRRADVHAGVWGGAVSEPLTCLSHILSRLADSTGNVLIPGFHDSVRDVSEKEKTAMRELVSWITAKEARAPLVTRTVLSPSESAASPLHPLSPSSSTRTADSVPADPGAGLVVDERARADLYDQLMQRWRFPTLTVHHVDVSTVAARNNATLIPAAAQATLSVRVVPDQSLEDIAEKLRVHVKAVFDEIHRSRSSTGHAMLDDLKLHLDVRPNAQWWLADPETPVYQAAARAIREEWQQAGNEEAKHVPLLIREGGSIPAVPWLERFFAPGAVAVNLPMGQSSDNAHLDNERIALENLMRGRQIAWRLLKGIGDVLKV